MAHTTSSKKQGRKASQSRSTAGKSSHGTRGKSAKRSKKANHDAYLARPFDPEIRKRAAEIIAGYHLILEPDEDGGFIGHALEMPLVFGDGATPDECVADVREALTGVAAYMLEEGETPPAPSSEHKRSAQINIRVTPEEKLRMEEAARRHGFRGVSDFVRSKALSEAG